jgi:hypothetical protein
MFSAPGNYDDIVLGAFIFFIPCYMLYSLYFYSMLFVDLLKRIVYGKWGGNVYPPPIAFSTVCDIAHNPAHPLYIEMKKYLKSFVGPLRINPELARVSNGEIFDKDELRESIRLYYERDPGRWSYWPDRYTYSDGYTYTTVQQDHISQWKTFKQLDLSRSIRLKYERGHLWRMVTILWFLLVELLALLGLAVAIGLLRVFIF